MSRLSTADLLREIANKIRSCNTSPGEIEKCANEIDAMAAEYDVPAASKGKSQK